jgi:hypothetical protein
MTRYFLNVHDGVTALDSEGIELFDLNAARNEAIAGLRGIVAEQILEGRMLMDENIKISNNMGVVLATITVIDAITILQKR